MFKEVVDMSHTGFSLTGVVCPIHVIVVCDNELGNR